MATIYGIPSIDLDMAIRINEQEARALDALVGYGDDAFIKHFYEKLGSAYMREHEGGLRSLFKSIRERMPSVLARLDEAKEVFQKYRKP